MASLARKHLKRFHSENRQTDAVKVSDDSSQSFYETLLFKLKLEKREIKNTQSFNSKRKLKAKYIAEYKDWATGVLASNGTKSDEIFMTILIWVIDTYDFVYAYELAKHAIKHDFDLPDEYKRNLATFIAEEVSNNALKLIENNEPVNAQILSYFIDLVKDKDMPDPVRAKLYKAFGYSTSCTATAIQYLKNALVLNPKSGVKNKINQLEKTLEQENQAETDLKAQQKATRSKPNSPVLQRHKPKPLFYTNDEGLSTAVLIEKKEGDHE